MDEELYGISFKIIAAAGDAHSQAQIAVKKANQYEFEEAEKLIAEAKNNLKEAHKYQTSLLQGEAEGTPVPVYAIMMHAYDHYAMALEGIDLAEEVILLNKKIKGLEDRLV